MNYAEIKNCDIANGQGVRISLFVSGCTHHCKNCFNAMAWDFSYGKPFTQETQEHLLELLKPDYIQGLTLLGGEPMEIENQTALLSFIKKVKEVYPNKDIWCYTGYVWEKQDDIIEERDIDAPALREIPRCEATEELLSYIDVLVDGPFIQKQKDITLRFKGSKNQRLIDMKESFRTKNIVLWENS